MLRSMLGGRGGYVAEAGGLLVALAALLFGGPALAQQDPNGPPGVAERSPNREEQDSRERERQAADYAALIVALRNSIANDANREAQARADDEARRLDEADLAAQQDMAHAAWLVALFALAQAFLTGVGIYYLRKTLRATNDTLLEAGRTTAAAEKATEVAREQVGAAKSAAAVAENAAREEGFRQNEQRHTDQINTNRQLRAYVGVLEPKLLVGSGRRRIEITLFNHGQTPAYKVTIEADAAYPLSPGALPALSVGKPAKALPPIDPKAGMDHPVFISDEEGWRRVRQEGERLIVFGTVRYQTFDEMRHTHFQWELDISAGTDKAGCRPCEDGNDAN